MKASRILALVASLGVLCGPSSAAAEPPIHPDVGRVLFERRPTIMESSANMVGRRGEMLLVPPYVTHRSREEHT